MVLATLKDTNSNALIEREIEAGLSAKLTPSRLADILTVAIGADLAAMVSGRVSTEVDSCLSFNTDASAARALEIIAEYKNRGVKKERILIKIVATWEGIRAAEILQKQDINCNLTLVFNLAQAIACADARVFLISPFVGRITDWYKKFEGRDSYTPNEDPGVKSVRQIYDYYKSNDIKTIVMGASFRNTNQIKALAGCDHLTISPSLMNELSNEIDNLQRILSQDKNSGVAPIIMDEATFRWQMNADAMATEKLAEGIRNFDKDHKTLIHIIDTKMASYSNS